MAAAANITVNNHAATAVTYKVMNVEPTKVTYMDDSQGTLLGLRTIELGRKLPTDRANGVIRVQLKVTRPVVNATTGALDYTSLGTAEMVFPAKASLAERREIKAALANALDNAVVQPAVETYELPS
jgi:hypothetical protein